MAFSEPYSYNTIEREQQKELLLTKGSSRGRTLVEGSSAHDSTLSGHGGSKRKTVCTMSSQQKVLVMAACLYMRLAVYGLAVAFGVINVKLNDAFNATRADTALIQSVYMGTTLGGGVLFAKVLGRYNLGKCVVTSSVIGTLALAVGAFGTNVTTLVALVGVVLGIAMSCILLATSVTISQTFTANRKLALTILLFGSTLGQIMLPFITYILLEAYNWSGTLLVLSGLVVLNCVPCGLIIIQFTIPRFKDGTRNKHSQNKARSMFKDPLFYFYILMNLIFLTNRPVEQWFVVDLAVLKGISFEAGSALLSVDGLAELVGKLIGSVLVKLFKDLRPEICMMSGFTAFAVAHYTVSIAPEYQLMILAIILRGLASGLIMAATPWMQIELNGVDQFATTIAVSNFAGGCGQIVGGYIGGYTVDMTGNYDLIFILATISAVYCAASSIVMYIVLWKRRQIAHRRQYQVLVD